MQIEELLRKTIENDASDLHLTVGLEPTIRKYGDLMPLESYPKLTSEDTKNIALSMVSPQQKAEFDKDLEFDFSYSVKDVSRFRVNFYLQKDGIGIAIRSIPYKIPKPEDLGLPAAVVKLTELNNGLVLVTGPTGSGKSTSLAALLDKINYEYPYHILTVEDPIEFVYPHRKSMVNQREVGANTLTFANALKHALREDPDVVLIGEMRDLETIAATLTIAETGHIAFATLHTNDAAQTIDRIVDVFPPHQQQQVRVMLGGVLRAIVCQQLLPRKDGKGRVAAREVLIANTAIANLIREGHTHQIYSRIQTGKAQGMQTMDSDVKRLFKEGLITREVAQTAMVTPELLDQV